MSHPSQAPQEQYTTGEAELLEYLRQQDTVSGVPFGGNAYGFHSWLAKVVANLPPGVTLQQVLDQWLTQHAGGGCLVSYEAGQVGGNSYLVRCFLRNQHVLPGRADLLVVFPAWQT